MVLGTKDLDGLHLMPERAGIFLQNFIKFESSNLILKNKIKSLQN